MEGVEPKDNPPVAAGAVPKDTPPVLLCGVPKLNPGFAPGVAAADVPPPPKENPVEAGKRQC